MGVRIIAKDVDAEAYATEYSAPIRRGLEGIHFLNTSPEKAAKNYAPGKTSGSVVGAPVATAAMLSCKGLTNFIQSAVDEADEMTIFCIARTSDAGTDNTVVPAFYGTYKSLGAASSVLHFGVTAWKSNTIRANAGFGADPATPGQYAAQVTAANISKWTLMVQKVSAAGVTLTDVTNNVTATTPSTVARQRTVGKFRLGSAFTDYLGNCDLALWEAHSVVLTDAEIATVVADLRAYAARRGISV